MLAPKQSLAFFALLLSGGLACAGELTLESTYESISVEFETKEAKKGAKIEYQAVGEKTWCAALDPRYFAREGAYRGSIVRLREDTEYAVRLLLGSKEAASGTIRTWKSDVPVAKTVSLDVSGGRFPIRVSHQGKPDGWIRVVPKGGKPLVNTSWKTTIDFSNSAYVLFEGFTIRGGKGKPSLLVTDCHDVRLRNCEISEFGPGGPSRWQNKGYCFENGIGCQCGAILLKENVRNVTIERCTIHTARGRAHSWRYSHPYGPAAIQLYHPESVVIRWCDFIGSDSRRFEDCVKCTKNGDADAGLNRNSDVYGCFFFGANDDGIELDGGQRNVRCFGNRFEEALMGVSVQYCNRSPSYVFDNVFTGLGTEFGHKGSHIKTSSVDAEKYGAASYFFHNTFMGPCSRGGALNMGINGSTARLMAKNNLFIGSDNRFLGGTGTRYGIAEGNHEIAALKKSVPQEKAVPNFSSRAVKGKAAVGAAGVGEKAAVLPERPVPWLLDAMRLDMKDTATFNLACAGTRFKKKFRVVKPSVDADWFEVKPMSGEIKTGKKITFTVTLKPDRMLPRHHHAAAFVIRDEDGFSRPVSVHYTVASFVSPAVIPEPHEPICYGQAADKGKKSWTFDIPEAGRYFLFVRGTSTASGDDYIPKANVLKLVIEGRERDEANPQLIARPTWAPVCPSTSDIYGYDLTPGKHTVTIVRKSDALTVEGFAWAREPTDMEGDKRHTEGDTKHDKR